MIFTLPMTRSLTLALAVMTACVPAAADEVIRIMAANTTSGNNSSYDPGEGNRIFQGLDPQIVLVQEMNVGTNSVTNYRAWVDANFGPSFSYVVESAEDIPNGIVSAYPILDSGEWQDSSVPNRDHVWARIDIPGDKDLWAISVHFYTQSASDRAQEAQEVKQGMLNEMIPATDYVVLGGDFNTGSRGEQCIINLSSVFVTAAPYPLDQAGNGNTNASRAKPYDWVLANGTLDSREVTLTIGTRSFPSGLVFDSRVTSPYSFLPAPVRATDSGATNMQHMAVMRAFLIPTNDPPVIVSAANSSSTETVTDPNSAVYEIVRGTSVGLSVAASDDAGEASLKYTWSKTAGAASPVSFSVNGTNAAKNSTVTFQATGDYTLTASVQDVPGLAVTSSVRIRVVQTAVGLALTPASTTLAVNATQAFSAALSDQFNRPVLGAITWSANGGGSISNSGIYTATTAGGPHLVTASSGVLSRTSSVTVIPASATVSLTNLSQTYDGSPKPVMVTTTPTVPGISVLYNGSPTVPIDAGSYPVIATITDPNYQGSTSATLVIAPDEWALWKNTHFTTVEQTAGLALDPADPDFDGLSNLAEYALDTNPRQFTPPLIGLIDAVGFSITFTRPASLPGIHYFAEASDDLLTWTPVPLEILTPGAVETLRARDPFGVDPAIPKFLRLRFERD